ncbi:hypothetical protein [Halomarina oriensis]|uniref:Uncharacterized protein n=1 Tax=Halomarina oriensis TaxID=671145 RepID=A0A6B0GGA0_9EURY|nr:hypothetical protein [Halomarina oriensis]MWG33540.1 hypothetical protein [Halomarina oriensis]
MDAIATHRDGDGHGLRRVERPRPVTEPAESSVGSVDSNASHSGPVVETLGVVPPDDGGYAGRDDDSTIKTAIELSTL